ncbi:hypothetical protein [Actinoallomurus sp. NPDC052274]|uniref:hypothetical protein n=1 Tax=Actinoallomurus sp. NPDC052274 TaxID=3155420 RepID=UPI0034465A1C
MYETEKPSAYIPDEDRTAVLADEDRRAAFLRQQVTQAQRKEAEAFAWRVGYERPWQWLSIDYTMARMAGATHAEALEAEKKLHDDDLRAYARARASGVTHAEALEINARGCGLGTYTRARTSGATHAQILDLGDRGIRDHLVVTYARRRRAGDDHEAACAAAAERLADDTRRRAERCAATNH